MFSGSRGQRARRTGPERGADLQYDLEITLEEAATGIERDINVFREEMCATCATAAQCRTSPSTPWCGRTGELRQERATPFGRMVNVSACLRCGGTGRVIAEPCKDCGGSGRVRRARRIHVRVLGWSRYRCSLAVGRRRRRACSGGPSGICMFLLW